MKNTSEENIFCTYYHYNHGREYSFVGHSHKQWEINVVTKGILSITYDDRVITLKKNMLFICESDVFHRNRVISREGVELFVYQFHTNLIKHSKTPRVYELDEKNLMLVKLISDEAEKNPKTQHDCSLCTVFPNYQATKLLEVLIMRLTESENSVACESGNDEKLYRNAVNFMKNNLSRNICIDDIAVYCHISPTKLKTVFTELTGEAVMTHFYNMKINAAKKMLGDGMSVGEVSDALGYSSQAYLTTVFKKITGVTPKEFKNKL